MIIANLFLAGGAFALFFITDRIFAYICAFIMGFGFGFIVVMNLQFLERSNEYGYRYKRREACIQGSLMAVLSRLIVAVQYWVLIYVIALGFTATDVRFQISIIPTILIGIAMLVYFLTWNISQGKRKKIIAKLKEYNL